MVSTMRKPSRQVLSLETDPAGRAKYGVSTSAIGSVVNLASRLESYAKRGQILVTASTYAIVRDAIEANRLGRMKLRGKEEEIEVFDVVGVRGA